MEPAVMLVIFAFTTLATFSLDTWQKRRKGS